MATRSEALVQVSLDAFQTRSHDHVSDVYTWIYIHLQRWAALPDSYYNELLQLRYDSMRIPLSFTLLSLGISGAFASSARFLTHAKRANKIVSNHPISRSLPSPFNDVKPSTTNAQRLAGGLPPLSPTRRSRARRSQPSSQPVVVTTEAGYIQVLNSTSHVIGYLRKKRDDSGFVALKVAKKGQPLPVTVTTSPGQGVTLSTSSGGSAFPFLGLCLPEGSPPLSADDGGLYFTYVAAEADADPRTSLQAPVDHCETNIWNRALDGTISAMWQNGPTGAKIPVWGGAYIQPSKSLFLFSAQQPGDVNPAGLVPITFKFVKDYDESD